MKNLKSNYLAIPVLCKNKPNSSKVSLSKEGN